MLAINLRTSAHAQIALEKNCPLLLHATTKVTPTPNTALGFALRPVSSNLLQPFGSLSLKDKSDLFHYVHDIPKSPKLFSKRLRNILVNQHNLSPKQKFVLAKNLSLVHSSLGPGGFHVVTKIRASKNGDEFLLAPSGTYILVLATDGKIYSGSLTADPTQSTGVINIENRFNPDHWESEIFHLREVKAEW
ncbi:MAG TPA: hypothetical protein VM901_12125 [Bdellovibrionota bacterium]|jgi:hypothetical protein|nr:hypothetical protein [Bdellovibrionota bacterium]